MTFAGKPRDEHVYHHAHESPWVMVGPLVVLAFFAVVAGWTLTPWATSACRRSWSRPGRWARNTGPRPVGRRRSSRIRRSTSRTRTRASTFPPRSGPSAPALAGFLLATVFYGLRKLNPDDVQPAVRPRSIDSSYTSGGSTNFTPCSSSVPRCGSPTGSPPWTSRASTARSTAWRGWPAVVARLDEWIDRIFVDGLVDGLAHVTYAAGLRLRARAERQPAAIRDVDRRRHRRTVPLDQLLLELGLGRNMTSSCTENVIR